MSKTLSHTEGSVLDILGCSEDVVCAFGESYISTGHTTEMARTIRWSSALRRFNCISQLGVSLIFT